LNSREQQIERGVLAALERASDEGLTGPQIHSVAPGSWEEISVALARLSARGVLVSKPDEKFGGPYPCYRLAAGKAGEGAG
jgi:hypothetical protein